MNDVEQEIHNSSLRISKREGEIVNEIDKLNSKVKLFTIIAWGLIVLGIVVAICAILYFFKFNSGSNLKPLDEFMSGSVAAVWSLAGLFFIYVAFLGQKQQLLNQQLEIMYSQLEVKYTRLELSGQKEEMKEQNSTLRQQKFETTFFQLLNLFNSIVNSLDLRNSRSKEVTTSGRDCFEVFYRRLNSYINQQKINLQQQEVTIEVYINAYDEFYNVNKSDMSHYFRTLYHIIKFIHNSSIDNKKQYIAVTRAQLSSYEQILLFYNCLHVNGKDKFSPLIEDYALFKNIDEGLLFDPNHKSHYKNSAYGIK